MRIVVEDDVFAGVGHVLRVLKLFEFAVCGRHRIAVDEGGQFYQLWLAARGREEQEACREAVDTSVKAEVREPARREVRVVSTSTDWDVEPPQATVSDALRLLQRPFRILVENHKNDFLFLLAMTTDLRRAELQQRKADEWLAVENGGGLNDMEIRIRDHKNDSIWRSTVWVLFDSDARRRNEPSRQSKKVRGVCGRRVPHHQLQRRAIENYVPRKALELWCSKQGPDLQDRVKAFYEMPQDDQRHYFHMKGGLEKDAKNTGEPVAEDLYGPPVLDPTIRARLSLGFGSKLRDVFLDDSVKTVDLMSEGAFDEINNAVTELLALMR